MINTRPNGCDHFVNYVPGVIAPREESLPNWKPGGEESAWAVREGGPIGQHQPTLVWGTESTDNIWFRLAGAFGLLCGGLQQPAGIKVCSKIQKNMTHGLTDGRTKGWTD